MKSITAASSAVVVILVITALPAYGQAAAPAQASIIVCPASAVLGVTGEQALQGWSSLLKASVSFKKAQVENGVGLQGPTLSCSYTLGDGSAVEVVRFGRPEPTGMLCTVNAVKDAEFDCFPRPGAEQMHPGPATRP